MTREEIEKLVTAFHETFDCYDPDLDYLYENLNEARLGWEFRHVHNLQASGYQTEIIEVKAKK